MLPQPGHSAKRWGLPAFESLGPPLDDAGQREGVVETVDGGPGYERLWDVLDQAWTEPVSNDYLKVALRKRVAVCSACLHVSASVSGVQDIWAHIRGAERATAKHLNADVVQQQRPGSYEYVEVCTGCGTPFAMARGGAWTHLVKMREAARLHEGARPLTIFRFSLTPVELPPECQRKIVPNGAATEPLAFGQQGSPGRGAWPCAPTEEAGSRGKRKRKRSRGRKRKRGQSDGTGAGNGHNPGADSMGRLHPLRAKKARRC